MKMTVPYRVTLNWLWIAGVGAPCVGAQEGHVGNARFVAEVRVGDETGIPLTYVGDLEIGPEGRVLVSQPMERQILVLDSLGRLERRLGRDGEGPGEFKGVSAFGVVGETIWASDLSLGRLTLFGLDGAVLGTTRLASPPMRGFLLAPTPPQAILKDGTALVRPAVNALVMSRQRLDPAVPLLRLSPDGVILDTLAWHQVRHSYLLVDQRDWFLSSSFQPFDDTSIWCVSPSGDAITILDRPAPANASQGHYVLYRMTAQGDTTLILRRSIEPRSIPRELLDSLISHMVHEFAQRPGWKGRRQDLEMGVRDGLYSPAFFPPASALIVDKAGRIWVREGALWGEAAGWDVFDAAGRFSGTVQSPPGARILGVDGEVAWGIEYDSLDVPRIIRYRIQPF